MADLSKALEEAESLREKDFSVLIEKANRGKQENRTLGFEIDLLVRKDVEKQTELDDLPRTFEDLMDKCRAKKEENKTLLHNTIMGLKGNICVSCRVRPS